jgi:hypothetical protein
MDRTYGRTIELISFLLLTLGYIGAISQIYVNKES